MSDQDNGARAAVEAAWFALARDFTYTGPHDRYAAHSIVADHRPRIEAAILANGAAFLPDAAELERLRRIEAAARAYIAHDGSGLKVGLDSPWRGDFDGPKTYANIRALRAALAPEGSARDGG